MTFLLRLMVLQLRSYLLLLQLLNIRSQLSNTIPCHHIFLQTSGNFLTAILQPASSIFPSFQSHHKIQQALFTEVQHYNHQLYNNNQEAHPMTATKEIVISLNRLTLPLSPTLKRLTLSVQNGPIEHFIQNSKPVRGQKINFYRENVFVQHSSQRLKFNLYSVEENGSKKEIASLRVEIQELKTIHKKPKAFKTESQGYQLIWDSWVFSEESSYLSQESSRDYSELDLPLNLLENNQSVNSSHSSYLDHSVRSRKTQQVKKRSNSTDETSSNEEKQSNEDGIQNNISESPSQKSKTGDHNQASPIKKRINVGCNLYAKVANVGSRMISQQ